MAKMAKQSRPETPPSVLAFAAGLRISASHEVLTSDSLVIEDISVRDSVAEPVPIRQGPPRVDPPRRHPDTNVVQFLGKEDANMDEQNLPPAARLAKPQHSPDGEDFVSFISDSSGGSVPPKGPLVENTEAAARLTGRYETQYSPPGWLDGLELHDATQRPSAELKREKRRKALQPGGPIGQPVSPTQVLVSEGQQVPIAGHSRPASPEPISKYPPKLPPRPGLVRSVAKNAANLPVLLVKMHCPTAFYPGGTLYRSTDEGKAAHCAKRDADNLNPPREPIQWFGCSMEEIRAARRRKNSWPPKISAPCADVQHTPDHSHDQLANAKKIKHVAIELANRPKKPAENRYKRSPFTVSRAPSPPALRQERMEWPRKVLGDSDRGTFWGDFSECDDSSSEKKLGPGAYGALPALLSPPIASTRLAPAARAKFGAVPPTVQRSPDIHKPLPPKPDGKGRGRGVESSQLPIPKTKPNRVGAKRSPIELVWEGHGAPSDSHDDERCKQVLLTVRPLQNISRQVDAMELPADQISLYKREVKRLNGQFDRLPPGLPEEEREADVFVDTFVRDSRLPPGMFEDERESDVTLDTFVREGHTSWVGTERPNAHVVESHYRRFPSPTYDNTDCAAEEERVARLRLREGNPNFF